MADIFVILVILAKFDSKFIRVLGVVPIALMINEACQISYR